MPNIARNCFIELDDYFNKYGFGDGDEDEIGWEHRETAKTLLNKHLKPFGITVDDWDGSSCHNNCRLRFEKPFEGVGDGDGLTLDESFWDDMIEVAREDNPKMKKFTGKQVVKALKAAEKEFDEAIKPDSQKVAETPDEQLALLIGSLDDDGSRELEKRFRSIKIQTIRKLANESKNTVEFILALREKLGR